MSPAVVLARGATGLRASAWLSARGTPVRHLAMGPPALEPRWPVLIRGEERDLAAWLGPVRSVRASVGVWYRGTLRGMPQRRRDLATMVGSTWAALAQDLRPHLRGPRTLGQWGRRSFGRSGWTRCLRSILSKRLGVSCDAEPAELAGLLTVSEHARWMTPLWSAQEAHDAHVEAVLAAGGDAVHDVAVEAIELDGGRVARLLTEFGREHLDGALVTDLAPWRVAELLPRSEMPEGEVAALRGLPVQERSLVQVRLAGPSTLPWVLWVADAHLPVVEVRRAWQEPGAPADDRVVVELQSAPGAERAEQWARDFLQPIAPVARVESITSVWQPLPTRDPRAVGAQRRLRAMGIRPIGAIACHRPYTLEHEARRAVGRARPELLTLPPSHHGVLP